MNAKQVRDRITAASESDNPVKELTRLCHELHREERDQALAADRRLEGMKAMADKLDIWEAKARDANLRAMSLADQLAATQAKVALLEQEKQAAEDKRQAAVNQLLSFGSTAQDLRQWYDGLSDDKKDEVICEVVSDPLPQSTTGFQILTLNAVLMLRTLTEKVLCGPTPRTPREVVANRRTIRHCWTLLPPHLQAALVAWCIERRGR